MQTISLTRRWKDSVKKSTNQENTNTHAAKSRRGGRIEASRDVRGTVLPQICAFRILVFARLSGVFDEPFFPVVPESWRSEFSCVLLFHACDHSGSPEHFMNMCFCCCVSPGWLQGGSRKRSVTGYTLSCGGASTVQHR